MSAHVIGRSPNSLAFGVPLIACARRAAAKPGLGGLVHFFPYNPLRPRFPDRHASLSIKHNKHRFAVELCPGLRILDRVPGPVLRDSDWPGPGTRRVGGPGYPGTRIHGVSQRNPPPPLAFTGLEAERKVLARRGKEVGG